MHVCDAEKLKLKIDKPTEKAEASFEMEAETVSMEAEVQLTLEETIAPQFVEVFEEMVGIHM